MSKYNLKIGLNSEILYNKAQEIRYRRIKLNVTQKKFSKCVRMDPSSYCRFEQGKLNISFLQYFEILEVLEFLEYQQLKIKEYLLCLEKKKIENSNTSELAEEVIDSNGLYKSCTH